jgi:hypothetical protein
MPRKFRLTARLPDGYVKEIVSSTAFTHYWRIVAVLENGKTEVFWGHTKSLAEANGKRAAAKDAAKQRGWKDFAFEIVELEKVASDG